MLNSKLALADIPRILYNAVQRGVRVEVDICQRMWAGTDDDEVERLPSECQRLGMGRDVSLKERLMGDRDGNVENRVPTCLLSVVPLTVSF